MAWIVYDNRISEAFAPAGMVHREMSSLSRDNERTAKRKSPVRSGAMRDSIDADVWMSGVFATSYAVRVGVNYAGFVLGGTVGPIRSSRPGGYLRMRPAPHSRFPMPTFHRSVKGQSPNPFLQESMVETLLRARVL